MNRIAGIDTPWTAADEAALSHPFEDQEPDDLLYEAWTIIANAHGGDWSKATPEWRAAAERWRDRWHESLRHD